ncbi:Pentatricopeptide repeat-containing protein [Hibiscus syriacus]|uniref:Pentatricopeptide repeat-containing protein n=1 Tax=Hibiscus syriacus TaxID=106335 RepID=A0A6A3C043_HIBSY|nr:Pentatricopeptide repeat-containing protein [Hibiscus syriacus]
MRRIRLAYLFPALKTPSSFLPNCKHNPQIHANLISSARTPINPHFIPPSFCSNVTTAFDSRLTDVAKLYATLMDNSNAYDNLEKSLDQLRLQLTTPLVLELLQRLSLEEKLAFSTKYKIKQFRTICDMLDYMKRSNRNSVPTEVLLDILRRYTEKHLTHLHKFAKKKRIRENEREGRPDANSYNVLFFGWCRARNPKRGMRVLEEMIQLGHSPDSFTYITAIDTFCKAGMVTEAAELFEFMRTKGSTMSSPTAKTYAIMIVALMHNNRMDECFELISQMLSSGCLPDVSTFKEMIEGMLSAGKIEEAYKFLEEMGNKGYPPDIVTTIVSSRSFVIIKSVMKL